MVKGYLHVGGDVLVPLHRVIAILEAACRRSARETELFFRRAEQEGRLEVIDPEKIGAYVITDECIYASPVSPFTLKARAGNSASDEPPLAQPSGPGGFGSAGPACPATD
ncbi:MAG TPA: DUF370 domain-containing protein [Firmicutes bacterium]|nr:DUF370 domain-containing protein [Bacillota bacterium]